MEIKSEFNVTSANILKVTVKTNCPMGGDSGHGGRTEVTIKDAAGTDMSCDVQNAPCNGGYVTIKVCGDTEAETLADALENAGKILKAMIKTNEG